MWSGRGLSGAATRLAGVDVAFRGYRYAGWTGDLIDAQVFYFGAFERPVVTLMADLLRRLDRRPEAAAAYRRAADLVGNAVERRFLEQRLREVAQPA